MLKDQYERKDIFMGAGLVPSGDACVYRKYYSRGCFVLFLNSIQFIEVQ